MGRASGSIAGIRRDGREGEKQDWPPARLSSEQALHGQAQHADLGQHRPHARRHRDRASRRHTAGLLGSSRLYFYLVLRDEGPWLYRRKRRSHRGSWEPAPAPLPRARPANPRHGSSSASLSPMLPVIEKAALLYFFLAILSQLKGAPSRRQRQPLLTRRACGGFISLPPAQPELT